LKKSVQNWLKVIKETGGAFVENNGLRYSAALSYYTVFSLAPMLIVIIWLGTRFFGQDAVEGQIFGQIREFLGDSAALQIEETIRHITLHEDSTAAAIIGFVTLFAGATVVFIEIQDILNRIWGVKPKPKRGLLKMITNRLLSFSMVLTIGFLMLVSLAVNAILSALGDFLMQIFPAIEIGLYQILNFILTFIIISSLFILMFRFLPDAIIRWKDVAVGAIVTAVFFILGVSGISLYLSYSDVASAYGAAGSVVVILVWVYYSSVILFFGAEFTQIYAKNMGASVIPCEYAVLTEQREIEKIYT
jgi:membrane protein